MIQTYTTRLVLKEEIAPSIYKFRFRVENGESINFVAGQYMILMVPQVSGQMARRLYSILTPPTQKEYFDIVIEIIPNGLASQYLLHIQENDEVVFQGPAGVFTLKQNSRPKIFLATGTGIVPMMSILTCICEDKNSLCKIQLLWGLPHYDEIYLFNELKALAKANSNLHITFCLSRESSFDMIPEADRTFFIKGRVTTAFDQMLTEGIDSLAHDYYVCGGREVVESLRQYLYGKNIPKQQVHFEKF